MNKRTLRVSEAEHQRLGEKIIVATDDDRFLPMLGRIIESYGYNAILAATTEEAEKVFHQQSDVIDLLLTDIQIPSRDGNELYRRLSSEHPSLRVLFMSGFIKEQLMRDGQLEPNLPFIEKPFMPKELMIKIREVLDAS